MARALELAYTAEGKTHPNPIVGCVIVKDGKVSKKSCPHAKRLRGRESGLLHHNLRLIFIIKFGHAYKRQVLKTAKLGLPGSC